jgi:hypothetical protein
VTTAADVAAHGASWGGPVVALVASVVFVVFSGWIVVQRLRSKDAVTQGEDQDA